MAELQPDDFNDKIEFAPPQDEAVKIGDELVIRLGKTYYRLPYYLTSEKERENYDSMTEPMKTKFLMNRDMFFQNAAKVLHSLDWAMGIGSLTKEKILFFKNRDKIPEKFKERKTRIVQAFLESINKQLWHDAPVVGNANEFAVAASAGVGLEGGSFSKGWGGQFELGISLGMNKTQKAFVFQIYRNLEKFKSTVLPGFFYAGLVGKGGIQIMENTNGKIEARRGESFYPPAAPGYLTETPSMVSSGMSSGLGVPPPPLGDLLTFTNHIDHKALIRVVVSPTLKGFVRIYFGLNWKSITLIASPIRLMIEHLQFRASVRMCNAIY